MEKQPYEAPKVYELGAVEELTRENPTEDKCGGSADSALPQVLRQEYAEDCASA